MTNNLKRILVITVPGLGDALFTTPLIRSLKCAYPAASIDVLVRSGRRSILDGNPDISRILEFDYNSTFKSYFQMVRSIFRRYDLAISTSSSDRATLSAFYAASKRIGLVPPLSFKNFWKRIVLDHFHEEDLSRHKAIDISQLVDLLKIKSNQDVIVPSLLPQVKIELEGRYSKLFGKPFCVVHPWSKGLPKNWPLEYWSRIVDELTHHMPVLLTGGCEEEEFKRGELLTKIAPSRVWNSVGKLRFGELGIVLSKASFFLGPDTVTTHLAASLGIQTYAIYGPSSLATWGPWLKGWEEVVSPYNDLDSFQRVKNVAVFQNSCGCSDSYRPCSYTSSGEGRCLRKLSPEIVLETIKSDFGLCSRPEFSGLGLVKDGANIAQ